MTVQITTLWLSTLPNEEVIYGVHQKMWNKNFDEERASYVLITFIARLQNLIQHIYPI